VLVKPKLTKYFDTFTLMNMNDGIMAVFQ